MLAHTPSFSKRRYRMLQKGPNFTRSTALGARFQSRGGVLSWLLVPATGRHCLALNPPLTMCSQGKVLTAFNSLSPPVLETDKDSVFPKMLDFLDHCALRNTLSRWRPVSRAVSSSAASRGGRSAPSVPSLLHGPDAPCCQDFVPAT